MIDAPLPTLETYYDTAPRAAADLRVEECPLLVLPEHSPSHARATGAAPAARTRALAPDGPDLPLVVGAVHAGFSSSDDVEPRDASRQQRLMERGLLGLVAAYDEQGDAVARVYKRVDFVRVGTACIAGEESS